MLKVSLTFSELFFTELQIIGLKYYQLQSSKSLFEIK